jgi:hypothetical protein
MLPAGNPDHSFRDSRNAIRILDADFAIAFASPGAPGVFLGFLNFHIAKTVSIQQ